MSGKSSHPQDNLAALRKAIKARGVNGFIVPRADEYQGEYTPPSAARLEWLSGFTGSAGAAVVLEKKAVVMTDGRYTIQIAQEVSGEMFETANSTKTSVAEWLIKNANGGDIIGYNPRLHTPAQIAAMEAALDGRAIELRALENNPLDDAWENRPAAPQAKVTIFPEEIAGQTSSQKRNEISRTLKDANVFAAILSLPDSICWLLNVRGGDVDYTPIVLSYAFVDSEGEVTWFVDAAKLSPDIKKHVGARVHIFDPKALPEHMALLAAEAKKAGKAVGVDFKRTPVWFKRQLEMHGAAVKDFKDPCVAPKAAKNEDEQKSIRAAHVKDAVALMGFMAWLDEEAEGGALDEISVAEKLEEFRRKDTAYKGPSFPTIAGFNANGAIVHYRASEKTKAKIKSPGLLLLDSGAQYAGGTTDITRTIAIGDPTEDMRRNFTLVLKGHIAVARAHFPAGTIGAQIDALARQPLWNAGIDYAHGTGHGVGCYLSVHEEAASISSRGVEPLKPGMLLSNEPGYYLAGEYGIRIENLVLVKETRDGMYGFETVSLAPIDRKLIVKSMLTVEELVWLNSYHAGVRKALEGRGSAQARTWLERQAAPI